MTGANSPIGIGRASAHQFARNGAKALFLCDYADQHLATHKRELESLYPSVEIHTRQFDAADEPSVRNIVAEAIDKYGRLDVFFANYTTPQIPAGTRPDFISIDGGQHANFTYNNETGSGIESALDFETMYSVVYPQEIRLYQVCDGVNCDSVGTFNVFLDALDESYCTYLGGDWPYIDPVSTSSEPTLIRAGILLTNPRHTQIQMREGKSISYHMIPRHLMNGDPGVVPGPFKACMDPSIAGWLPTLLLARISRLSFQGCERISGLGRIQV